MYKYFPHTETDIQAMLQKIACASIDDLFADVSEEIRVKQAYNLPTAMSEMEIRRYFEGLASQNQSLTVFAGAGAYDHYAPSVIQTLLSRSEFLTAYTPYQPEISQGTLQYIFEFQSMITSLTGMDCTHASMYDGATAAAEAMMMAVAATKKKNKVLLSKTVHPLVARVVRTYAKYKGVEMEEIAEKEGVTDFSDMEQKLAAGDVAGVIVAATNFYGIVEDYTAYSDAIHAAKALFIMYADPSTLAVLKTPAEWGADMACGDGQSLGIPLQFGGPYVGYLATTKELVRTLPGSCVGLTHDVDGKRAFVLSF